MKKIRLMLLCVGLSTILIACGGDESKSTSSTPKSTATTEKPATQPPATTLPPTATPEPTETPQPTEKADTNKEIAYHDKDGNNLKFIKYEEVKDYEGNPAVGVFFKYTNNTSEAKTPMFELSVKAFQNGIQNEIAIVTDAAAEYQNSTKEIKPDASLDVCWYFKLEDKSDIELEVEKSISLDSYNESQVISLTSAGSKKKEKTAAKPTKAPADETKTFTSNDGSTLTYVKHTLAKDYEGNAAIAVFFDYTNNSDKGQTAMFSFGVKPFQNGIECQTAIVTDAAAEYQNSTKEIKSGASVPVCWYFSLEETKSAVDLEVSDLFDFGGNNKLNINLDLK